MYLYLEFRISSLEEIALALPSIPKKENPRETNLVWGNGGGRGRNAKGNPEALAEFICELIHW